MSVPSVTPMHVSRPDTCFSDTETRPQFITFPFGQKYVNFYVNQSRLDAPWKLHLYLNGIFVIEKLTILWTRSNHLPQFDWINNLCPDHE